VTEKGGTMTKTLRPWGLIVFSVAVICLSTAYDAPARECREWAAKVVSMQGSVEAKEVGKAEWRQVNPGETYQFGDIIRVQERGRAAFLLCNHTILRLDEKTTITFSGLEEEQTFLFKLLNGAAHFFNRIPRSLKVLTPFVNANVEGTEFLARVDDNQTVFTIFEGRVAAVNVFGSIMVESGQSAMARTGQAPVLTAVVRPRDAVRWALYYPAAIDFRPVDFPGGGWLKLVRESIRYYRSNDIRGALFHLAGIAQQDVRDPRYFLYRAVLLLTVGQVDDAVRDIEKVLKIDPSNGDALALQSVIAVVQNRKDEALKRAAMAVDAAPDSSSARIAMSYAQQARFDLGVALEGLREAVKLDPENALAWARLSELWLSVGEIDKSLDAAQRAVDQNPDLARTQSVLGFAYLMQVKLKESVEAFTRAVELDAADPQPRLGLGLTLIRQGRLEEGRRDIEIAAGLDPNNALLRSYMGKAYFEEKRGRLAEREYTTAKYLDPKDPTPWFYDAIRKQSVNRPVEALQDLETSIELNDNRAVYRSRLMLDQDLAARSASLARIYSDLGFEQRALVEGWKSLNGDPANFTAHRLLADLYSALPRHEQARTSELLRSQLLQPINITPVQPQLAESKLRIHEGTGPANPSFNEYNPLFNRNQARLQASGVWGEKGILGNELTGNAVYNRFSLSLGQFYYESDGFRANNDQQKEIYNLFMQASPSYKTSIQAELRYTDTEYGDLPLRFDPYNIDETLRQRDRVRVARVGLHHAFSPRSDTLFSLIYGHGVYHVGMVSDGTTYTDDVDMDSYMGEVQHIYCSGRFSATAGAGYTDVNADDAFEMTMEIPGSPPMVVDTRDDWDVHHTNLYVYTYWNVPKPVTWTLGASADFFNDTLQEVDREQVNPKIGLTWNLTPSTTFRAAAFRMLNRTLVTSQTIEPTQVAGFNQFYDDVAGTHGWRYGAAIDRKFRRTLFGGLELSKRDIDVPWIYYTATGSMVPDRVKWKEQLARGYLYWTPTVWLALSGEYQYERFDRDSSFYGSDYFTKAETHRFPLGLNLFCPLGFTVGVKGTYVDQEVNYYDYNAGTFMAGSDYFWVFDASVGYRLPERYGILTLEVKNVLDKGYRFQDTDPISPRIYPERLIVGRFTLSF
jgi:tetratricopeptide (TPR) repeat protein